MKNVRGKAVYTQETETWGDQTKLESNARCGCPSQ